MKSLKDGLMCYVHSIKSGFTPTIFTSNQLINLFAKHGRFHDAQKLFDEIPQRNVFSWNAIIAANIKSRNLGKARELFESTPQKDLVTYNSMLSGYVSSDGYEFHALELFVKMQTAPDLIRIDEFSLTIMLNLTAELCAVTYGKQLHSFMMKTANDLSGFAVSSLIDMYSKCGCFKEAYQVYGGCNEAVDVVSRNAMVAACCREGELDLAGNLFKESELNDVIAWNTMISGYVQNGFEEDALKMFVCMASENVQWNEHTFASVLSACSNLRSLKLGKEVHGYVLKNGLSVNSFIGSGLVDVYCKCNAMKYAESVHAKMGISTPYSTTSLIVGHSSQCNMEEARRLFDSLDEKNSVVWTALFSGYAKLQQFQAVFDLLTEYREKEATVPDELILISITGACAVQAALAPGKQIHSYILRARVRFDTKLISSLVDMYSKCGSISYAERIFREVNDRDSVLYNIMIAGYAHHGLENKAVRVFMEMRGRGLRPDAITFVALLSACRHGGLVKLGEDLFHSMAKDHNICPEIDHYACMIDLYGRANQLDNALAFMRNIPIELDAVIWGAFLNACRINGNSELAREAEEKLLMIEGENGARYVQLANVFAAEGNWEEMGRIRKKMKGKDVKKNAGCSWIFVENKFHIFTSGDRYHSENEAIYSTLASMTDELLEIEGDILLMPNSYHQFVMKNG